MIVGHGVDVVHIDRIARLLAGSLGRRFMVKCFSPAERARGKMALVFDQAKRSAWQTPASAEAQSPHDALSMNAVRHVAGNYALKEAMAKALGVGIGGQCRWHDIERETTARGAPQLRLWGEARATLLRQLDCSTAARPQGAPLSPLPAGETSGEAAAETPVEGGGHAMGDGQYSSPSSSSSISPPSPSSPLLSSPSVLVPTVSVSHDGNIVFASVVLAADTRLCL
ncbi:MAG: holo-ACP synthase [Alphaproteobacteria bacterium]|nr:holo-ACP synthase [Alphaproteobacteria bacterium]